MGKRRRATPRLMRVMRWSVERAQSFRRRNRPELDGDVVLLQVQGEWEHGQRQSVRAVFPVAEVEPLACELLAAVGVDRGAGVSDPPSVAPVAGSPVVPPPTRGGSAGVAGPGTDGSAPSRVPLASPDDRRGVLIERLDELLETRFGDRPARARFIDPVLARNNVGSLDELPTPALASMANQLLRDPSH